MTGTLYVGYCSSCKSQQYVHDPDTTTDHCECCETPTVRGPAAGQEDKDE